MAAPPHIARENGKKGGRPKGSKSKTTLEREKVLAAIRQRILSQADGILDAQLTLARGLTYLYKIEKYYEGRGKNRVLKRKQPKLVTSQIEIEAYLAREVDEGDMEDPEDTYFFITTKDPNNQAIDSLLDRTFGKAVQYTENMHRFDSFTEADLRTILSVLPQERQDQVYETITSAIADAELLRSGGPDTRSDTQ